MAAGWADGNSGENQVSKAPAGLGIEVAFNEQSPVVDCQQQYRLGPYTLDFAWPKLQIALEGDGSVHSFDGQASRALARA